MLLHLINMGPSFSTDVRFTSRNDFESLNDVLEQSLKDLFFLCDFMFFHLLVQELNIMLLLCSSVNSPFIQAPAVRCVLEMHLSHVPSALRNHECREDVAVIFDLLNLPFHFLGGFSSTSRPRCTSTTFLPPSPEIIVTPPTLK